MTISPLHFARDYEKFLNNINSLNVPDRRLLQIVAFWPTIQLVIKEGQYRDYVDEYVSLLADNLSAQVLFDITIEELSSIRDVLLLLKTAGNDGLIPSLYLTTKQLVTQLFYVGAVGQALPLCAELTNQGSAVKVDDALGEELDSFETLGRLLEIYETEKSDILNLLREIHTKWEIERTGLHNDRIWCLFVEKDRHNRSFRGRMRQLVGKVTPQQGEPSESDTVIFDHQIKTPDDSFIGVAYDSIKAVKALAHFRRVNGQSSTSWLGHFSINESSQVYTGDSIGLAFGLLTYAQLLKTEVTRHERFISSEIAVTGSLNDQGDLQAVNRESLEEKIRRVFFSHIGVLVVPMANLSSARHFLDQLAEKYPRRQLHLIGHEKLSSAVRDKNAIQPEKVCIGQFIARKAYKYSRATKIQVPLLLGLCYLLVCLMFPKAWPWFDWNPQYMQLTERGFEALNQDSLSLWGEEYDCYSINPLTVWAIGNMDSDSENEVVFSPQGPVSEPCDTSAVFYVYDDDGSQLFSGGGVIMGEYPGDEEFLTAYNIGSMRIDEWNGEPVLLTTICEDSPSRTHLKIWNTRGVEIGWYVQAGAFLLSQQDSYAKMSECFLVTSINNRLKAMTLAVLPDSGMVGVSPPYEDSIMPGLSSVKRGNQLHYIVFPPSDVNRALHLPYNHRGDITVQSTGVLRVSVSEDGGKYNAHILYFLDSEYRVTHAEFSDEYFTAYEYLVDEGRLSPLVNTTQYLNRLRDNVRYFKDGKFVTEGELRALEAEQ